MPLIAVASCAIGSYLSSLVILLFVLKDRQPAVYQDLGSPNLITLTLHRMPAMLNFILTRQHRKSPDKWVGAFSDTALISFLIGMISLGLFLWPAANNIWDRIFVI